MGKIRHIWHNSAMKRKIFRSVQSRISFAFVALSLLFVMITSALTATGVYRIFQNQTMERLAFTQGQLSVSLEKFTTDTNQFINSIIIQLNSSPNHALAAMVSSPASMEDPANSGFIMQVAGRNLDLLPDAKSINVLLVNGQLYTASQDQALTSGRVEPSFLQQLEDQNITTYGGFYTLDTPRYDATSQFYCKELRDISLNRKVGYVFLEIPQKKLQQYCVVQKNSAVVVCDEDGKRITGAGDIALGTEIYVPKASSGRFVDANGISWLYTSGKLAGAGWYVTCLLDTREALQPIYRVMGILTGLALLLMAVMSAICLALSRQLAEPIKKLSAHMAFDTNTLPQPIAPEKDMSDETRVLYHSFNDMIRKNQKLFEDFKREEIRKQQIELSLVQSQIKPHFLYNTLDTIYCLVNMERNQEACAVTKALADYYRVVLSNGQDWIGLHQECKALYQYLTIMQTRFPELRHEIMLPSDLEHIMIPKLLLQPLVENAIQHGIRPKNNRGSIRIFAEQMEDGAVEFSVADNGVGLSEEKFLLGLQGVRDRADREPSFGLQSVLRRLELSYGERSALLLKKEGQWTIVKIRFYPGDSKHV